MKARPTIYNGIQMRSRLEARVAAWLDSRNIRWEYEPVAFASGAGQYLPDFRVYTSSESYFYLEVRPDVDGLVRAQEQMTVIHASEPDAFLMCASPDTLEMGFGHGRGASVTSWFGYLFVKCPCGGTSMGWLDLSPGLPMVYSRCRRCNDVAWRDPKGDGILRMPKWGTS